MQIMDVGLRGWTAVMPQRSTPPRGIMLDSVREYVQIIMAARRVIQEWRRYQRVGRLTTDPDKLAEEARFVSQTVVYALRLWLAEGAWSAYYEVRSGAVHNCMACRTIDPVYTYFQAVPELNGLTAEEVVARGVRMCAHCRNRAPEKTINRVERMVDTLCIELEAIAQACDNGLRDD